MAEYIDTFGNSHSLEWEVFDNWGWTVLHRASAFGTADNIETLINYGASPTTPALPLRWTALHHAVFYGNLETFLFLIDPIRNVCIHSPDARGWTLLHIAASAGHGAIVRHLLSLGANHKSLSQPYDTHMPDELLNKSFAPGRAALAQGLGRYEQYISALRDFGLEEDNSYIREMDKDGSDDDDIFVDAEETFIATLR
jgi:ankyrin repeat protein